MARLALSCSLLFFSSANFPHTGNHNNELAAATLATIPEVKLPEVVIQPKKVTKHTSNSSTFMDFDVEGKVNTAITKKLEEALEAYSGPDSVMITSLRRNWGTKSAHEHGKAVDFKFDHKLIEWLVSEEGTAWRETYSITFYIEGKPGSRKVRGYKNDPLYSKYVFENPSATGDHVHMNI